MIFENWETWIKFIFIYKNQISNRSYKNETKSLMIIFYLLLFVIKVFIFFCRGKHGENKTSEKSPAIAESQRNS